MLKTVLSEIFAKVIPFWNTLSRKNKQVKGPKIQGDTLVIIYHQMMKAGLS